MNVDVLSPKNAPAVTISPCHLIPTTTTHSAPATECTLTLSSVQIGNIVTLTLSGISFTGDATTVTCAAVSTLTAPYANCYFPIIATLNSAKVLGSFLLTTSKTIVVAAAADGTTAFSATPCGISPAVMSYSTV